MPCAISRTPVESMGSRVRVHEVPSSGVAKFRFEFAFSVNLWNLDSIDVLVLLMHVARERLDVLDRRRRQDAVAQVEDVARPSAGARQHVVGRGEDAIERAEQQRRIEVALNRPIEADARPTPRRAACASRRR